MWHCYGNVRGKSKKFKPEVARIQVDVNQNNTFIRYILWNLLSLKNFLPAISSNQLCVRFLSVSSLVEVDLHCQFVCRVT